MNYWVGMRDQVRQAGAAHFDRGVDRYTYADVMKHVPKAELYSRDYYLSCNYLFGGCWARAVDGGTCPFTRM